MTFEWCLNDDETVFEHEEHAFAPYRGVWEGVCDTPLPCRPEASANIKKPDTCREFLHMYPAFLAGVPDAPGF